MKINFYKPKELDKKYRLTVHKSGKLGFPMDAAEKLNLKAGMSIGIGINEEDFEDDHLYMQVYDNEIEDAFKVAKAGQYYYLNTKLLFDNLELPYESEVVSFEMSRVAVDRDEAPMWKLKRNLNIKTKTNAKTTKED